MRALDMLREYRRLRRIEDGASYLRLEAFGRAIAAVERERRFNPGPPKPASHYARQQRFRDSGRP